MDDLANLTEERARLVAELAELRHEVERLRLVDTHERGILDAVLRHSPHGIIVCDAEGRLVVHNPAAVQIWAGAEPGASLADWSRYRAFHPDGRPFAAEDWTMARSLRERAVIPGVEFHILRFDGTPGWLLGSSAPLLDERGELLGALSIFADITLQKEAERTLRRSEERHRQILDSVQDMVFTKDRNLTVTYANAATCRYYGLTVEQLRGLTDVPFNEQDFTRQYLRDDRQVLESGQALEVREEPNVAPSGETRWFHTIKTPIVEAGQVVEIVGVSRDVTERRQAEQRLRAAHQVAAILAESSTKAEAVPRVLAALGEALDCQATGYWRVDPEDDHMTSAFRWTAPEIDAAVWDAASAALVPVRGTGLMGTVWATGRPLVMTDVQNDPLFLRREAAARLGLRSAIAFPVVIGEVLGVVELLSTAAQPDDVAHVEGLQAIGRNIAQFVQRVRAQEALERQLGQRELMAAASELFATSLDPEHVLRELARLVVPRLGDWCAVDLVDGRTGFRRVVTHHWNPARVALAEELERRYPTDPDAPVGAPAVLRSGATEHAPEIPPDLLAQVARDPEHLRLLHELGLRSYVVVPIAAHGDVLGALTVVTAESGRRLDGDDVATAEELARRAAVSLDNARLYAEAQRLIGALERTNAELDQFAYVTSHDLKAPLRGIANLSQWIEEDLGEAVPPAVRKNLELLRGRVQRMDNLIQGILNLSRAARVRGRAEEVDLRELIAEVSELLQPQPPARIVVEGEAPRLVAERASLQQVLLNLLGNALKHGGPAVTVVARVADRGDEVEVAIADDGPGIPDEYHDRVWGIFQTLEARDKVENTGIGLAIVRKAVESRGGRAWIDPGSGPGATFRFTWPKRPLDEDSAP